MFQIIEAKTKKMLASNLSLNEAGRYIKARTGCYMIPMK